jgi:hypothetical protein
MYASVTAMALVGFLNLAFHSAILQMQPHATLFFIAATAIRHEAKAGEANILMT